MSVKKGVLLINLGTPDSPSTKDVRKYLREFLMDKWVIDVPFIKRWILVNLIIAPLRAPKSAKIYQELWTEKGSPLLYLGMELTELMREALGAEYQVEFGMRYQNPSLESVLDKMKDLEELVVIPLYPQYATASTESTIEKVEDILKKWKKKPVIKYVEKFPNQSTFIKAFVELGEKYLFQKKYDHVLFSYHGLPERQILKASCDDYCQLSDKCCSKYHSKNEYCYRAQCFETSRHLAKGLGLSEDQYTVCFQSRLGKTPWIKPYTDEVIVEKCKEGKKSILCFAPAFTADCLETTIEIGVEYKEIFEENGGEHWQMVESLNTSPTWVQALKEMIIENE